MVLGVLLALALLAGAADAQDGAHAHILQVVDPSAEAVEEVGFLTQALGDAGIAEEYASYAAGGIERPGDLGSMQTHARNVLHTLDPARVEAGPGFDFGVIAASRKAIEHVRMAADAPDATDNVRTHARHVVASVRNTIERAERMIRIIERIEAAEDAAEADALADQLHSLAIALRNGEDADGDGEVTWQEGEGGLYQARRHMELMMKAEGLENETE